ncbi:MAG TPA: biotin/lipoyl-containing protein [Gaiellaceae bacterium]|jgi:acetyl-CoA carboxylase biotin carboxyl carrier protein
MSELTPEDVREILRLVDESRFDEFELETPTLTIRFRRDTAPAQAPAVEAPAAAANGLAEVTSPMVGTFYRAPSPDAPPFVEPGSRVEADSPVCIVEVMKLMNRVAAGVAGEVVEVCRADGESVQYGDVLFRVRRDAGL